MNFTATYLGWSPRDIGAGTETRTPDNRITNAVLYQLSYPGAGPEAYY